MARILIVDDVEAEVVRLGGLLRSQGHQCIEANDGAQAVTLAKSRKPNLILLDVVMGEHDGFKACRQIKADPETKDIPIVFVTAKSDDNARWWAERIGAAELIEKPVVPERLFQTVSRLLTPTTLS